MCCTQAAVTIAAFVRGWRVCKDVTRRFKKNAGPVLLATLREFQVC